MSTTDDEMYSDHLEMERRHSAIEEFTRDERRPAVLLLGALIIAAVFFALGIVVGRWATRSDGASDTSRGLELPVNMATPTSSPTPTPSSSSRPSSSKEPSTRPSR